MKTLDQIRQETVNPAIIADQRGLITYVNKPFEDVFGWTAQDIRGLSLTTIIPRSLHDSHQLGFSRFLSTGKPTLLNKPLMLRAVTKSGQEFDAEHLITAEQYNGHWEFGAIIRPLKTS